MPTKILLDTDIGTDIDDAVCLAYLLANPDCKLMGITTVTGEAEKRAMLASALCRVAGKDIPIFPGAECPLIAPQKQTTAPQAAALKKWDHQRKFPRGEAIEFLRQTIRANSGEIILLTIGPLTNIALLFAVDPEIPSLLKGLLMMCGYFFHQLEGINRLEWNAYGDPHATTIVYQANAPIHRSIGLDVTCQVTMNSKKVKEKFRAELLKPVLDFAEVWFEHYHDSITFHDPLAATTIFDDQICQFQSGEVTIELENKDSIGFTYWKPGELNSPHQVASEVDKERFFTNYFSVFD
ncbi:MAG: nucleoside hydrolase [bacterium]|nr:MAG: nucleoside hydrolase [bacterium]